MKKVSIISPCFNEESNVEACWLAVKAVMEKELPGYDFEHIFVDNASTDRTVAVLRQLAASDDRVKVIINARNYGPFRSTFNALRSATGDAILVMLPVDLQDPAEMIPVFVRHWEAGAKIVYGQRTERAEGVIMRAVRGSYYRALNRFAEIDIPVDTAEFQLVDRVILDLVLETDDYYPYIRGLIANVGYSDVAVSVPYRWRERRRGMSKNRMFNLVDQAVNGLVSFTSAPLRLAAFAGFILSFFSFAYGCFQLAINLIVPGLAPPGIPTLIVANFFLAGIQLLVIGLVGEYVAAIHQQIRRGGRVVERETINIRDVQDARASRNA